MSDISCEIYEKWCRTCRAHVHDIYDVRKFAHLLDRYNFIYIIDTDANCATVWLDKSGNRNFESLVEALDLYPHYMKLELGLDVMPRAPVISDIVYVRRWGNG